MQKASGKLGWLLEMTVVLNIHNTTAISSYLPGFLEVYVYTFTCTCNIIQIKQLFKSLTVMLDTL